MTRGAEFERYWTEFERPGHPSAEALPPTADVAGAVATAVALRQHADALPAFDLDVAWESLVARMETPGAGEVPAGVTVLRRPKVRLAVRVAAAAVAAMIVLASASLRATPGSALYPVRLTVEEAALAFTPDRAGLHERLAEARLGDLLVALRLGPVNAAPGLARSLVRNRAAAVRAGADVRDLDVRIVLDVPPALREGPDVIAARVRAVLGSLLPPDDALPVTGPPTSDPHQGGEDRQHHSNGNEGGRGHGDEGRDRHRGSGSDKDSHDRKESGDGHEGSGDGHEGSGDGHDSGSEDHSNGGSDGHGDSSG